MEHYVCFKTENVILNKNLAYKLVRQSEYFCALFIVFCDQNEYEVSRYNNNI